MAKDTGVDSTTNVSDGIATPAENATLDHSEGGMTTRQDNLDTGVPMLPGDGSERQGPEDALGEGPKRGDYRDRIGPSNYHPHTTRAVPDAKPGEPQAEVVPQRPNADDIGDAPGLKGGVDTDPASEIGKGYQAAQAKP